MNKGEFEGPHPKDAPSQEAAQESEPRYTLSDVFREHLKKAVAEHGKSSTIPAPRENPEQLDESYTETISPQEITEDLTTPEEMVHRLYDDPSYLPPHATLRDSIDTFYSRLGRISESGGDWRTPYVERFKDPDLKIWCELCGYLRVYEFWTKEYIDAFGDYLADRVENLGGTPDIPTVILEVGAGDGRLTHFLKEKLDELIHGKAKVVATDSGVLEINPIFPVENNPFDVAIKKYQPRIVICSWMTYGKDFTSSFRAIPSVDEYILIGETDGGCCGDSWETWGYGYGNSGEEDETPPYIIDGFTKEEIKNLSALQISRADVYEGRRTTKTVSFVRKK